MTTPTVYLPASHDGRMAEPVAVGEVAVIAVDWACLDDTAGPAALAVSCGLEAGLPEGLIDAVVEDFANAGIELARPAAGPERPWVYLTGLGEGLGTHWQSEGVEVVYGLPAPGSQDGGWAGTAGTAGTGTGTGELHVAGEWSEWLAQAVCELVFLAPEAREQAIGSYIEYVRSFAPEEALSSFCASLRDALRA